jgi:TetR/AcrR family transcriptional regulator, transcriptional repressor for nem operon
MGRTSDAKERLVRSGRQLMLERGYTAVGVAELCDRAGVNKGSFYHAFPSKQELALEVIDSFWADTSPLLDEMVTGDGPPLERLRRFFAAAHAQQRKVSKDCGGRVAGCPLGSLAQEMSSQDPVLRKRLGEVFDRHVGRFERLVAEAVGRGELPRIDTRRAARSLVALLEGALLLAKTWNDPEMLGGLGDDALRLLGVPGTRK